MSDAVWPKVHPPHRANRSSTDIGFFILRPSLESFIAHNKPQRPRCGCKLARSPTKSGRSLLEKVLEGLAGIGRPSRRRRGRLFFDTDPHGVEGALIAFVLAGNPFRNRLGTFEPAGSIEIRALPAGVQFESALRTFTVRFNARWEQSSTLCAPRNGVGGGHLQRARTEGVFSQWFLRRPTLALFAAVLITTLTIFPVGHKTPWCAHIVSLTRVPHKVDGRINSSGTRRQVLS